MRPCLDWVMRDSLVFPVALLYNCMIYAIIISSKIYPTSAHIHNAFLLFWGFHYQMMVQNQIIFIAMDWLSYT